MKCSIRTGAQRGMIFLVALVVALPATFASADMRVATYSATRLKNYLQSKNPCLFAVGSAGYIKGIPDAVREDQSRWPLNPSILCVGDFTVGAGTIQEMKGCGLAWFDVETNRYEAFSKKGWPMVGKNCLSGGFEDLLKQTAPVMSPYTVFVKLNPDTVHVPIATWLTDYGHSLSGRIGLVLLSSARPNWTQWWKKERASVEMTWARRLASHENRTAKEGLATRDSRGGGRKGEPETNPLVEAKVGDTLTMSVAILGVVHFPHSQIPPRAAKVIPCSSQSEFPGHAGLGIEDIPKSEAKKLNRAFVPAGVQGKWWCHDVTFKIKRSSVTAGYTYVVGSFVSATRKGNRPVDGNSVPGD